MKNPITYCADIKCSMGVACCGCPGEREARAQHNARYKLPTDVPYILVCYKGERDTDISSVGGRCTKRIESTAPLQALFLDTGYEIDNPLPIVWLVHNISNIDVRGVWAARHNENDRVYDGRVLVNLVPEKIEETRVQKILNSVPPAMRSTLPDNDLEAALEWAIRMMGV